MKHRTAHRTPDRATRKDENEMKMLEKMVLAAIKEHNNEDEDGYLTQFNHKIRLVSMGPDRERGAHWDTTHNEYPNEDKGDYETCNVIDDAALRLAVKCKFKPVNEFDDNVVKYEVDLFSNGEITIYFDGTEYAA